MKQDDGGFMLKAFSVFLLTTIISFIKQRSYYFLVHFTYRFICFVRLKDL